MSFSWRWAAKQRATKRCKLSQVITEAFSTSDGIYREESGYLEKTLNGKSVIKVSGTYSYTGDDGFQYTVSYTADENGYKPHVTRMPKNYPGYLASGYLSPIQLSFSGAGLNILVGKQKR